MDALDCCATGAVTREKAGWQADRATADRAATPATAAVRPWFVVRRPNTVISVAHLFARVWPVVPGPSSGAASG